jgi:hypothetical protein
MAIISQAISYSAAVPLEPVLIQEDRRLAGNSLFPEPISVGNSGRRWKRDETAGRT